MNGFIKHNKRALRELNELIKFKRRSLENAMFDKKKMFEMRGRIIMSIKNIELILKHSQ